IGSGAAPMGAARAGTRSRADVTAVGSVTVVFVERVRTTVRWVEASSTSGGTAATVEASTPGTVAVAATRAWAAFAVTDMPAPAISSVHGYQAERCPSSATTATVATTISPSTSNGHIHACPEVMPERTAR